MNLRTPVGTRPWLAALLSAIWPGLGQLYNREYGKAAAFAVGQFLNLALIFASLGLVTVPLVWAWGIWDAAACSRRSRTGL